MIGDNPKKDGDKTTPTSSPQDVACEAHAGKKLSRKALIEAEIVALFQKGLAEERYGRYDTLLQNEALRKSDPVKWVQDMSKVLDISGPAYPPSMPPLKSMFPLEGEYLAELLAIYIDNARATSYQMRIASGVAPKHSQTTSTPVGPTQQNTSDAMAERLKKLNSRFEALGFDGAETPSQNPSNKQSVQPLTLQRSAHEATNPSSAPKPAKAAVLGPDEKQQETSEPRSTSRRNP